MRPCDLREPGSGVQAKVRSRAVRRQKPGHRWRGQTWGAFLSWPAHPWGQGPPQPVSLPSSVSSTDWLCETLPAVHEGALRPASWDSGTSVVIRKLSIAGGESMPYWALPLVSERGDPWKQDMSSKWTPCWCYRLLQKILDQIACPLSACMTPVRGIRQHTFSTGI